MQNFFKRFIFIFTLFFSSLLFADGTDITISVSDSDSDESSGDINFTITLSETPDWCDEVVVNYATEDGSAKAGSDYTAKSGSVTFYGTCLMPMRFASPKSQTVSIPLIDDTQHEDLEDFFINISNSTTGYSLIRDKAHGVIYDNDLAPLEITTFNEKSITESDSDQTLSLVASFNRNLTNNITLTYHTEDGTASSGSDYIGVSDTITVNANSDRVTIPITIKGDLNPETTENFKVVIDSISEGTISDAEATATIYDDDAIKVDVHCDDASEGDDIACKIYLAKPLPAGEPSLTINYTSQDGSAPSAIAGEDYTTVNGSVTFNTGDKDKFVNIQTIEDNLTEQDENVKLLISGSSYIIDSESEAEIINDDGSFPGVDFSTGDVSVVEGNSSTKTMNFNFHLDKPAIANSSFDYYTQDNTAKSSDSDYVKINSTTYNIPEGSQDINISVTINGDIKIENDELFYLKFTNEKNIVILGHTARGTIINDDGSYPNLSFDNNSYAIVEGNSSTQSDLNFTITLDAPALSGSSFDYYTEDSSAKVSDSDYVAIPRTTYNIPLGVTQFSIPVKINGDDKIEGNERFYLKIDNEHNLTISGTQSPYGQINNDDGEYPTISIEANQTQFIEGNSSKVAVDFTIKLDIPAPEDGISVEFKTVDDGATLYDNDYDKIDKTLVTFHQGEESKSFRAYINGDTKVEGDENFYIELHNPTKGTLARGANELIITILNDDIHSTEPFFSCTNTMYISSDTNREDGRRGRMWLHSIDTTTSPFRFEVLEDNGADELYNATAYNPDDNYIYGLYHRDLVKITRTADVINLGKITGLPERYDEKQLYAGAIANGYYYVTGRVSPMNELYKIRLSDLNVTTITMSESVAIQDFSFYKDVDDNSSDGKFLYGIDRGGKLTKIDVTNGAVTQIGQNHTGYEFDSTFSDRNGRLFANDSEGKGFYEFNLQTGAKLFLSNSQPATYNDGANCIDAELIFNDYGDAPRSYGEARHKIANGIRLGANADHDITPYYSVGANGDDNNGTDDEDGVTLADGSELNGAYFELNKAHNLEVTLSKEAYLNIWIDKDINGHFDDASDLVYNHQLTAGTHTISFSLPNGLQEGVQTYLRARVSSKQNMNPTGFVTDGEVEDYAIKFGEKGIKGTFNIQRTNSLPNAKDFNLYTQIVGRDFNYHIVAYNNTLSQEQNLTNVPVKVELFNKNSNKLLYTTYRYFSTLSSRVVVLDSDDLKNIPATKEALFKISYATDAKGNIVQGSCGADYQTCYNSLVAQNSEKTVNAQDSFAIRPESFYLSIADGNIERVNSRTPNANLTMSAGYEYNLSIVATKYPSTTPSPDYNRTINGLFDFNSTGMTKWEDNSSISETINMEDGLYNNPQFKHNNVGVYTLLIPNDENWTLIDQTTNDCILNSSITSSTPEEKSGCNIAQQTQPISLKFYPDHFKVDLTLNNLPNSGHDDFIYMSELNSTYSQTAIALQGKIVAQTEDNQTTTNFTVGCMATDIDLELNASTLSVEGIDKQIKTIAGTDVNFIRYIQFNNDMNDSNIVNNLVSLGGTLTLSKNKFLDENNGTATLDIRYNLNKNLTEPINPVQVTFNGMSASSPDANSTAHTIVDNYMPKGEKLFNATKNFYYAIVVSDLNNYPRVNMNISPVVRTPLNVDIYCKTTVANHCATTNVLTNTSLSSTTREQNGWYLSYNHNGNVDGNVTALTPNFGTVTINHDSNITLPNGSNGLILNSFNNCSNSEITVTIATTPALTFNPSQYTISCTENNASQWTGIGKTGNVLSIKPKVNGTGKMDW